MLSAAKGRLLTGLFVALGVGLVLSRRETRRERAIRHIHECRDIHIHWIDLIKAGKKSAAQQKIGGNLKWHKRWVKHYNLVQRELGDNP